MDCSRTSVRQGAAEVTLVYRRDMKDMPASNEVHEAIEEGVQAIFQAAPTRIIVDETSGKVTGVEFIRNRLGEPDASGRRRPEPSPGTEFTIDCDRVLLAIGQGPELDWIGPGSEGPQATKNRRLKADPVTFETDRPGVFGTGDVRIGAATVVQAIAEGRRASYAADAFLKGLDLAAIRTRQTLAEPQPEFLSIVPFTSEVKEPRYRLKAMDAEIRNKSYVEYELPYTPAEAVAESTRCLQCTCEAIGFCDLRRLGIEYGTTLKTLEPQFHQGAGYRSVTENRFTGFNHDYIRDDSHAFILREPSRCIDCGRCAQVCSEVVGAACYDFMRIGFDTLVTTPLDMSLNDTPCVSCGRCAETCPTGALMPKPRVLEKYEVDESRCILCGICVDACPYDALRDGADFELAHVDRSEPMIDLIALAAVDRETEVTYIRRERDWLERATAAGRAPDPGRLLPVLPASIAASAERTGRPAVITNDSRATATAATATARPAAATPTTNSRGRAGGDPGHDPDHRGELERRAVRPVRRDPARLGAARRDDARHHPLRSGDDRLLRGAGRDLRDPRGARSWPGAQVLVYIGAISVLVLFAIMLTQTKAARPGSCSRPRPSRRRSPRSSWPSSWPWSCRRPTGAPRPAGSRPSRPTWPGPLPRLRPAVRGGQRPPPGGGHRRHLPGQARARAGRGGSAVSESLDSYLILSALLFCIGTFGFLARRNAISMLMSIELMLNAVNLSIVAFGAFNPASARPGLDHRPAW